MTPKGQTRNPNTLSPISPEQLETLFRNNR